jgi:hypothetical protein
MVVETMCLWIQAGRGVPSHFNAATPFDAAVFGAMGIMILINSFLGMLMLGLFFQRGVDLPRVYLWGIRLGLGVFLLGSLEGMAMIASNGHAVGATDDGPRLPFFNWSLEGGDLRIAHMLGLHALQLIPLFSYLLLLRQKGVERSSSLVVLWASSLVYLVLMGLAFLQALSGSPFVSWA